MGNVTVVTFNNLRECRTAHLWQYDYGQILKIEGLELPEVYEVHFSNTRDSGTATTSIGDSNGVVIPDTYLASGGNVYAWIYLHTGENDGETEYSITIPVKNRPEPTDDEPTPEQQSAITQAIAALNAAVESTGENAEAAAASAEDAEEAANRAEQAANTAGYMEIEIDENGHLIYTRTNAVDVDFSLSNGHLIMEVV